MFSQTGDHTAVFKAEGIHPSKEEKLMMQEKGNMSSLKEQNPLGKQETRLSLASPRQWLLSWILMKEEEEGKANQREQQMQRHERGESL